MLLSVVTFSANDPSLNHVVSRQAEVSNQAGLFGAYTAGFLNDVFGIGAYIWPLVFGALGASCVSPAYTISWWRWCGLFLLTICLLVVGAAWDLSLGDIAGGGMIGGTLHSNSSYYLSPGGSGLVWFFIFLVGVQLTFNFSWVSVGALCVARIRERILQKKQEEEHKPEIVTHGQELASLPFHKRILAGLKQKTPGKGSDFWRALRDKLGNIRPAKDPMPEIYPVEPEEVAQPAASAAPVREQAPVAVPVSGPDDDDDFFAPAAIILKPGETVKIPTGIRVWMEPEWVLKCYPRSGLGFKYRLQLNNTVGIIDSDYFYSDNEGHIFVKLTNDTNEGKTVSVAQGTGMVQGIFMQYGVTIDDDATEVRNGGFGSTTK